MDRIEIHTQISILLDKINFLNNKLAKEKSLHPVEIDLLQNYNKELNKLIEKLMDTSGVLSDDLIQKIEDVTTQTEEAFQDKEDNKEEKTPEPEPKPKPESESEPKQESNQSQIQAQPQENGAVEKPQQKQVTEEKTTSEPKAGETNEITQPAQEEYTEKRQEPIPMQSDLTQQQEEESKPQKKSTAEVNGNQTGSSKENDSEDTVSLNDRFKQETVELADKLKQTHNKDLKDLFELNERFTFINELFEGDSDHFNKTLKDLERCGSLEEATQYLNDHVEARYDWSEKDNYANKFKSAILKNFESKIEL